MAKTKKYASHRNKHITFRSGGAREQYGVHGDTSANHNQPSDAPNRKARRMLKSIQRRQGGEQ